MGKKSMDLFVNTAYLTATQGAVNAIAFGKIESGVSLFEKVAWVIHKIEYYVQQAGLQVITNADRLYVGLTTTDQLTALTPDLASILNLIVLSGLTAGTAASFLMLEDPVVVDLADLPGDGMIIPPNPLYLGVHSAGFSSEVKVECRVYYTHKALKPDEYWELVEARRIIT